MGYHEGHHFSGTCDLCGEPFDQSSRRPSLNEVGEFVRTIPEAGFGGQDITETVIAHAQCGLDAGLELA